MFKRIGGRHRLWCIGDIATGTVESESSCHVHRPKCCVALVPAYFFLEIHRTLPSSPGGRSGGAIVDWQWRYSASHLLRPTTATHILRFFLSTLSPTRAFVALRLISPPPSPLLPTHFSGIFSSLNMADDAQVSNFLDETPLPCAGLPLH